MGARHLEYADGHARIEKMLRSVGRPGDLTHVTERRGRPFTLVCTKTRASHERRLAEYAEDVSNIRALVESAPGGKRSVECAAALERLHGAVAAAGGQRRNPHGAPASASVRH